MVETRNAPPSWMGPWLKTPMYGESCRCEIHKANYTTVTCGECMGSPHCQTCWEAKESMHHPGHEPILQVYIASRRLAIRVESISGEWDVSDIQIYNINGHEVLHLDTNGKPASPVSKNVRACDEIPKCQKCKRKIKESKYGFCSIACKYHHVTGLDGGMHPSLRRRSRKGIPRRAPFF